MNGKATGLIYGADYTRDALYRTLAAASRASTRIGMPTNAAVLAGLLLHLFGSADDAVEAVRRLPAGDVWAEVINLLAPLAAEERADTQRPSAVAGEGYR